MSDPFARVAIEGDTGRGVVRREHAVVLAAGHFPGDPFLPGAYLVELMAALAERVAAPARVRAIVRCAFARRVRPDTEIVVIARAAGVLPETVRHYADLNLIEHTRLVGGQRMFRASAAQRVREIYTQRMANRGRPRTG